MGYFFVLPKLLIVGIFVLFPMLLNFYYAMTGGTKLFPADRPFVGLGNFETLFDCENFLQPNSCQEDLFWRGIFNTIQYVIFQVSGIVLFSLIRALMGFYTLILLAGLQSIPPALHEASSIDGANNWQDFRFVTMPLLMPTMYVVLVLSLIRAVQMFDHIFVLTGGGPGTRTQLMVQYIYNTGFSSQIQLFGLSAAASMVLGVSLLILTLLQLRVGNQSSLA